MSDLIKKISIGTVQFGLDYGVSNSTGKVPLSEVRNILELLDKNNIEVLDTASAYGDSELVLGELIGHRDFKIITKINDPTILEEEIQETFKNLKREVVYATLFHHGKYLLDDNEAKKAWSKIESYKKEGRIEKLGASFNDVETCQKAINKFPIEIVQIPMNIFDQRFLRSGLLEKLKSRGIEIHCRSVFLQGLFFMREERLDEYFSSFMPLIKKFLVETEEESFDKLGALIKFVANNEFVDHLVLGVQSRIQLEEIIRSLDSTSVFTSEQVDFYSSNDENLITPSNWKLKR